MHNSSSTYSVGDGSVAVSVQKAQWRLSVANAAGKTVVREQSPAALDMTTNVAMQINKNFDQKGEDKAYPGLPTVSTRPLSFLRNGLWQHVTSFIYATTKANTATIRVATSDHGTGVVTLVFRGADVDLTFTPNGALATAVGESFVRNPLEHYYGGGGRFLSDDLSGLNVPMWVSHGTGADELVFTNEVAVPYLASTAGWGM